MPNLASLFFFLIKISIASILLIFFLFICFVTAEYDIPNCLHASLSDL